MLFLAFLLFSVILLLSYLYWHVKVYDPRRPPLYHGLLPFIGHAYIFRNDTSHFWELYKKASINSLEKGGANSLYIFWLKLCVLTDPHDCQKVANRFLNKGYMYDFTKIFLGNGLLTSDGIQWKRHKKLINPTFSLTVLEQFMKIFNKQSRKLAYELSAETGKKPFDHLKYLGRNSLETVCSTVLGLNDDIDESMKQDYMKLIMETEHMMVERFLNPLMHVPLLFDMSPLKRQTMKAIKQLHNISSEIILKKKLNINKRQQSNVPIEDVSSKSFLDMMLESNADAMTDKELQNEVDTLIVTGYETSSSTLMTFFLLLGTHPEIQDRVRKEIEEVFGTSDRDVDKKDLNKLVYMEAVINETLRLYPTLPLIARQTDEEIKLDKWILSKDTCCVFSTYGLHRHPAWGPDVDQFRPERWLDQTTPDTSIYFIPFGIGRRSCIGKTYSMMSMKTTVVHLLRRYRFFGNINNLKLKYEITLKPDSGHEVSIQYC